MRFDRFYGSSIHEPQPYDVTRTFALWIKIFFTVLPDTPNGVSDLFEFFRESRLNCNRGCPLFNSDHTPRKTILLSLKALSRQMLLYWETGHQKQSQYEEINKYTLKNAFRICHLHRLLRSMASACCRGPSFVFGFSSGAFSFIRYDVNAAMWAWVQVQIVPLIRVPINA